jgi:hypothetical protein
VFAVVLFLAAPPLAAGGTGGGECACGECEELLRAEYVESRVDCAPLPPNAAAPAPPPAGFTDADGSATVCAYSVLDIRFSVWPRAAGAAGAAARVEGVDVNGKNQYTGGCRACLSAQPNCTVASLQSIRTYTFTLVSLGFAATSMALETYSLYKFVKGDIGGRNTFGWASTYLEGSSLGHGGLIILPLLVLACLSPFIGLVLTAAKLFPLRYACETVYCSRLVHNAVMSLTSAPFDTAEIVMVWVMEANEIDVLVTLHPDELSPWKRCFVQYARPLVKATKTGSLACSAAWIIYDLILVRSWEWNLFSLSLLPPPPPLSFSLASLSYTSCPLSCLSLISLLPLSPIPHVLIP